MFESTSPENAWDGTFNGEPQPMGVYAYSIEYKFIEDQRPKLKTGNVTLVR